MNHSFKIDKDEEGLRILCTELDRAQKLWNVPKKAILQLNLVLDELITNIIEHGQGCSKCPIEIELEKTDTHFNVKLIDGGRTFDPTRPGPIDTSLPVEKRKCGGLGLHLVKQLCDQCSYNRVNGKNIFTFSKTI